MACFQPDGAQHPGIMTAKTSCPNCAQSIEFDMADAGQVVPCPNCEREVKLSVAPPIALLPALAQIAQPASKPSTVIVNQFSNAEYLTILRAKSCYRGFRKSADVGLGLCGVAVVLAAAGTFFNGQVLAGALIFLAVVPLIVADNIVTMLADMADMAIQNRKS